MRAKKRKTILVIINLLYRNLPALHGVTLRTIRPHLALVNIGVAILASLSHVGEYRLGMALRAGHLFMHAAKRILSLIVVEFGNRADWPPACGRVAILARYGKGTVRTSSGLPLSGGRRIPGQLPGKQQQPTHDLGHSERNCPRFPILLCQTGCNGWT